MNSINVQKVVWAAEELKLPYVRHDAGMAYGVVGTPEYRAKNPNGLVPMIEDDGFVLWESNTIVRYLCAKHAEGSSLWPADPADRADGERWGDWQATSFYAAYAPAFMNLVRTPPEKRDMAAVEASRAKTETLTAMLDAHLAGRDYLGRAGFGVGDLILGPTLDRWLRMPIAREPRPHLEAWHKRSWRGRARPASATCR